MGNNPKGENGLPAACSYQDAKDLANHLNKLCKQNEVGMGMLLILETAKMKYNNSDWKRTLIPGRVSLPDGGNGKKFNIVMNLKQAYKAHQTLKHFEKNMDEDKKMTPSSLEPDENLECCICFEKAPTMVLPCSVNHKITQHQFCDKCTEVHILEKDDKRCPVCRMEFKCDGDSFAKQIYTVIGEEENLDEELALILLDILKQLNSRQVENIKRQKNNIKKGGKVSLLSEE